MGVDFTFTKEIIDRIIFAAKNYIKPFITKKGARRKEVIHPPQSGISEAPVVLSKEDEE